MPFGERFGNTLGTEHDGTMKAGAALPPYPGEVHVVVVDDERRMVELVTSYLED